MDRPRQPAMPPASRGTRRTSGRNGATDRSQARAERRDQRRGRRPDDRAIDHLDSDEWPDQRSGGVRALVHGFAVVRWILMILAVGFGVAAVIAIAFAALFALVNASV